jgi:two-component system CheB/CheR fusion protein
VWGDSARLSQVFWNLIKNAVKFTPAGGSITIRTQNLGGQLLVTVTDTGIGIEPEAAGRIFDAFEQESRTITRAYGGLGLGLAISKALVGLHGGAISVVSGGKGHGATFAVRLTTIPAAGRGEPARVATNGSGGSDGERRHLRILLVEDHEATAQVMAKLLRGAGYDVALATSVREAKQRVDGAAFDLLVSDNGLPDGTGLDVVRHLRATRQIPAIAVSGYGMADDLRLSYEAGFDEHLVKPIDLPKLQAAIRRVMGAPKV